MLVVVIPKREYFNESDNSFINTNETTLQLEHSLVSLSKWESKWRKPFLEKNLTTEETTDYIRHMTLTEGVDPYIYNNLPDHIYSQIKDYVEQPMTATWFGKRQQKNSKKEIITAEIIYYWMIAYNIPVECQYWHLDRLLTLIRVCDEKNNPPKKMSRSEILSRNTALNEERKKQLGTKG